MGSPSSRLKNDISDKTDTIERLLLDGFATSGPPLEISNFAEELKKLGLIEVHHREFVRCADPQDADYPPKNRHCQGRVFLNDFLDEGGHEFRCPECERPVFPHRQRKRRHTELQSKVRPEGVAAFITAKLTAMNRNVKQVAGGVYRVDVGSLGVFICLADYCLEVQYLTRDWAKTNATCYIVVNAKRMKERFLKEDWLSPLSLASVVSGQVDLSKVVDDLSHGITPGKLLEVSVPVYDTASRPIVIEPAEASKSGRRFVVEVGPNIVRVEGEIVVAAQAGTRFQVFKLLWECFLKDLIEGRLPEKFSAIPLAELTTEIEKRKKETDSDEMTVRRAINRLQDDIGTAVKKKTGLPIGREDVVQTCRWKGQSAGAYGYRLQDREKRGRRCRRIAHAAAIPSGNLTGAKRPHLPEEATDLQPTEFPSSRHGEDRNRRRRRHEKPPRSRPRAKRRAS